MTFKTILTIAPAEGKDFVSITEWADPTLNKIELRQFNELVTAREQWEHSLIIDGTIISATNLRGQVVTVVWAIDPSVVSDGTWTEDWVWFRERWLRDTGQIREKINDWLPKA